MAWPAEETPASGGVWLECNGQTIDEKYKRLRELVGDKTPNYQGIFLRGYGSQELSVPQGTILGNGTQTYSSKALGEVQGDAIRPIHTYDRNWLWWRTPYYSRDRYTRVVPGYGAGSIWQFSIPDSIDLHQCSFLNWDNGDTEENIWVMTQPPKKYRLEGNGGENPSYSLIEEEDRESGRLQFVCAPRYTMFSDITNPGAKENRPVNKAVRYFIKAR